MGRKKIPVYSIVAADSRYARDGRYIEDIGRYFPLREPAEVRLDEERALHWLENGAQPSDTVRSILHRRGILLHHHLKQKGEAPDEIEKAVEEFRAERVDEGEELKMVVESQGRDPLEKERERAEEIDEEAQLRAQATPLSVVQEEEADAGAEADDVSDEVEADAPDAEAEEGEASDAEEEAASEADVQDDAAEEDTDEPDGSDDQEEPKDE